MSILDDESNADVLSWMPDGDSFTIVNHRLFATDRMHKLFNIRNMSSFVRKLTRWGFNRLHEKTSRNSDVFKHKLFRRGRKDLVKKIRCVYRPSLKPDRLPGVVTPNRGDLSHKKGENLLAMPYSSQLAQPPLGLTRTTSAPGRTIWSGRDRSPRDLSGPSLPPLPVPSRRHSAGLTNQKSPLGNVTSRVVSAAMETLRRDIQAGRRHPHEILTLPSPREAAMLSMLPPRPSIPVTDLHPSQAMELAARNRRASLPNGLRPSPPPNYNYQGPPPWMRGSGYSY